jgi:hypothetical protein
MNKVNATCNQPINNMAYTLTTSRIPPFFLSNCLHHDHLSKNNSNYQMIEKLGAIYL